MRPLIRRQIFGTLSYAEAARPNGMRVQRVTQSRTFLADRFQLDHGVHGEWLSSTRYHTVTNRKCCRGSGGEGGGVRAGVDPGEAAPTGIYVGEVDPKTDNSVNFLRHP